MRTLASARRRASMLMLMPAGCRRAAAADRADAIFDIEFAGLLEGERSLHGVAVLQALFEAHEHHVVTARLELDGFTRLDVEAGHRPHGHGAAVYFHFMHLEFGGDREIAAGQ